MNTLKIDDRILPYKQFSFLNKVCIYEYGTCENISSKRLCYWGERKLFFLIEFIYISLLKEIEKSFRNKNETVFCRT